MRAAETFAKVGMAVNDAFVACWHAKYRYNCCGRSPHIQASVDEGWLPILTTPPFPE